MAGKPGQSKSLEATPGSSPRPGGIPSSPSRPLSPSHRKIGQVSNEKHRRSSAEDAHSSSVRTRSLWPSITASSSHATHKKLSTSTETTANPPGTLADHLGNERLMDFIQRRSKEASSLTRQRSCSQSIRFANDKELDQMKNEKKITKENRPFGGSMRYTRGHNFLSSSSSSIALTPVRVSVDDYFLERRSNNNKPLDSSMDILSSESESSEAAISSSTTKISSLRKSAIGNMQSRSFGRSSKGPDGSGSSPNSNVSSAKTAIMKRANSLTAYGSSKSQWALSPGRTQSPPLSGDDDGGKAAQSFSTLRPPGMKAKSGMGNFLSLGLELLKGKRSCSSSKSSGYGAKAGEAAHELRLLHNRLLQWRFANARAEIVNKGKTKQSEITCSNAWANISKLRKSVVQKRVQLESEKLEIKLNSILGSQIKYLEAWEEMERQHFSAVSNTKDRLQEAICRVPFVEGAKADLETLPTALHKAENLATSINRYSSRLHPMTQESGGMMSELAFVVAREKALLEECHELLGVIGKLQVQERSLRCHIMQSALLHKTQLQVV